MAGAARKAGARTPTGGKLKMKRVCHLSSVHRGLDIRIFRKECVSLARAGYETHLVIGATGTEVAEAARLDVMVHPTGCDMAASRIVRMSSQALHCYRMARALDADLYHFHDPELIPYGVMLAWAGKKVVVDVHEDLSADIDSKEWVPPLARRTLAVTSRAMEHFGARRFAAVIAATPFIGGLFRKVAERVVVVNNYPLAGELLTPRTGDMPRRNHVCYVGGIDAIRGIQQIVEALPHTNAMLHLAGPFCSEVLRTKLSSLPGWERVIYHGVLSRGEVAKLLSSSVAGLVTFLPEPNHVNAQPNKMFEYMSAGVPVIASDFSLWNELIEGARCGICVDPKSPAQIAAAIRHLCDHPLEAEWLGENGRRAVEEKYRWDREEEKLLSLYESLLNE
jgi:glycosyltransferase involved in cell wall biosynthesis